MAIDDTDYTYYPTGLNPGKGDPYTSDKYDPYDGKRDDGFLFPDSKALDRMKIEIWIDDGERVDWLAVTCESEWIIKLLEAGFTMRKAKAQQ